MSEDRVPTREEIIQRFVPEVGQVKKTEAGTTLTGKATMMFHLLQIKMGLRLQARGIAIRSGRSVLKQAKEEGIVPPNIRTAAKAFEYVTKLEEEVRRRYREKVAAHYASEENDPKEATNV